MINETIVKIAKRGAITAKDFLDELSRLEKNHEHQTPQRYVLVTSLSLAKSCQIGQLKGRDFQIDFKPNLPKKYVKSIAEIEEHARNSIFASPRSDYLYV